MVRTVLCFLAWSSGVAAMVGAIGCQSMGGGLPAGQGSVVISGHGLPEIQTKAEEVFHRHGFDFRGLGPDTMQFERTGGMVDNLLYGNWRENDTVTQITLFITPQGADSHVLRLRSEVVRNTFGFDDQKSFDLQGSRYGVILKKIAQELAAPE